MDAGADLATKKSSAPSERLSWLRLIREYTHSSSTMYVTMVGSDSWLNKISSEASPPVSSRPGEGQSEQAWMLESRAEPRSLGAAQDMTVVMDVGLNIVKRVRKPN